MALIFVLLVVYALSEIESLLASITKGKPLISIGFLLLLGHGAVEVVAHKMMRASLTVSMC